MSRNRNNSMQPMSNIRDDFYRNGPTPAVFNEEHIDKCLFENDNYKNATADNTIHYDTGINSIHLSIMPDSQVHVLIFSIFFESLLHFQ